MNYRNFKNIVDFINSIISFRNDIFDENDELINGLR